MSEKVPFEIVTVPDCKLMPLQPGGFGEGSKWDEAAKVAIELHDQYLENKQRDPKAVRPVLKMGFFGKEPRKARSWVQDMMTQRVRRMTAKRSIEKEGGQLRIAVRIGLDAQGNPCGLRLWAEADFLKPPPPKPTPPK